MKHVTTTQEQATLWEDRLKAEWEEIPWLLRGFFRWAGIERKPIIRPGLLLPPQKRARTCWLDDPRPNAKYILYGTAGTRFYANAAEVDMRYTQDEVANILARAGYIRMKRPR